VGANDMCWSMPEWSSVVQVVQHGKSIGPAKACHNPNRLCSHNDGSVILEWCCRISSPLLCLSRRNKKKINTETTDVVVPVRIVDAISLWMRLNNMWITISSTMIGNTPHSSFEGWFYLIKLPEKHKSNSDISSHRCGEPDPKLMDTY
jgi:hypothetical protein